jgi:hypothetical protein
MIEDFSSAENYYSVWSKTLLPERTNDLVDLICANNPFVINYDWPGKGLHAVTVYGYKGWDYGNDELDELGFWDWFDSNWPEDTPNLRYEEYNIENFRDVVCVRDTIRHPTSSYAKRINVVKERGITEISWTNTAITEMNILGYNVVVVNPIVKRLNEAIILPAARFGDGEYGYEIANDVDLRDIAIQVIMKDGDEHYYPVQEYGPEADGNDRY